MGLDTSPKRKRRVAGVKRSGTPDAGLLGHRCALPQPPEVITDTQPPGVTVIAVIGGCFFDKHSVVT